MRISYARLVPLVALVLAVSVSGPHTHATDFVVSSNADTNAPGTLRRAIEDANAAGAGTHTITFTTPQATDFILGSPLPHLNNAAATINLIGNGASISGNNAHRVFFIESGTVRLDSVSIVDAVAQGGAGGNNAQGGGGGGLGAGGAVFVNQGANVTMHDVVLERNQAKGGNGGDESANFNGGGGGGGFGGSGGSNASGSNGGGGGGGGFGGNGGNGSPLNGGGGGGLVQSGQPATSGGAGGGAPLAGDGGEFNGPPAGDGQTFGGGGGGSISAKGGDAGDFAGGGGAGADGVGGIGGFGGGGGGSNSSGGAGGFGAGSGGSNAPGNGGSGYGGAIFVREGGTLTMIFVNTSDNGATAGASGGNGATAGQAAGQDLYVSSGVNANFNGGFFTNSIGGAGGVNLATGVLVFTGLNTYTGGTTVNSGTFLSGNTDSLQGNILNNSGVAFDQNFAGTYAGEMSGSGSVGIYDTGIVTFTGANSYTGGTTVDTDATLIGTTNSLQGSFDLSGALKFDQSFDGTFGGSITGQGQVFKLGTGNVTFTGTNGYLGGTTISAGSITGSTSTLTGNFVVDTGASLIFDQASGPGTFGGNISGGGSLVKNGFEALTLTGTNTYTGGTTINFGSIVGNTVSIQGNILNNTSVTFNQIVDGTYAGNMSGSGGLTKSGAGVLTLTGTNTYTRGTVVLGGVLVGNTTSLQGNIINSASVKFNQTTDGIYAGNMSGTGSFIKEGAGALSLSGNNSYTGPTQVNAGRLAVDSALTSDVTTAAGTVLGGHGTITGNVTSSGTVAPGNSIGTLTINGNYTMNAGSSQQVEINDAGTTPGVNNDLLVVTGDAAVTGNVNVVAAPGTYTSGTRYNFLSATNIIGQYSGITLTGLASNWQAILGYDLSGATDLAFFELMTSNFAAIAQTYNEFQVGTYLDTNALNATGPFRDILDELGTLPVNEQRAALNELGGTVNGTIAQLGVQDATYMYMLLRRRIGSAYAAGGAIADGNDGWASASSTSKSNDVFVPVSRKRGSQEVTYVDRPTVAPIWGGWTAGYGFGGHAASDGNAAGGTYGSGGTMVALERPLSDVALVGFFGAYSHLSVSLSGLPQNSYADQGQFGGYFLRDMGKNYLLAAGSVGFAGYKETRRMSFGTVNATAHGEYDGWQPTSYLELGRREVCGRTTLQPYGALQYVYVRQNSFTETGAGTLNQAVDGIDTHALRGLLGARASQAWLTRSGRAWIPELRAVWMHEFLQPETTLSAVFAPVGGASFATRGLNFGRDWAVLGTGTQYVMSQNVSLFANYDLMFNSNQALNAGSGGVQFVW